MATIAKGFSHSAPKISYFSSGEHKVTSYNTVSQGATPTLYCIHNFPIVLDADKNRKNLFFDESLSICELQMLGQASPLEPINQVHNESSKKAKSECKNHETSLYLGLISKTKKSKTTFFDFSSTIREEEETKDKSKVKSLKIDIKLDLPEVKLQPPPIHKFKKRRERCALISEVVEETVLVGEIKNYNLKGRFGIVKTDSGKYTVYEDDLLISGVSLRRFKKAVSKKEMILVEFKIKRSTQEVDKSRIQVVQVVYKEKTNNCM